MFSKEGLPEELGYVGFVFFHVFGEKGLPSPNSNITCSCGSIQLPPGEVFSGSVVWHFQFKRGRLPSLVSNCPNRK